jgi:hypothetical protein
MNLFILKEKISREKTNVAGIEICAFRYQKIKKNIARRKKERKCKQNYNKNIKSN